MNILYYGEDASAFDKLVDFAPANVRPVKEVISSTLPSKRLASELERDFTRLDEISRLLKSRHNDCCPLFLLPPECIGTIIHLVASVESPKWNVTKPEDDKVTPNSLGWIRLGHVCQRLRGILTGMRALWASSAFSLSPKSFKEIISRAGGVPLTIDPGSHSRLSPDVLSIIREHIHNAAVIKFEGGALGAPIRSRPWPFGPENLHEESFPFLERLSLEFPAVQELDEEMYGMPPINAPRLRHVFFENAFVPCVLSSLDSFELQFMVFDDSAVLPPTTVFHDMLRSLSNVRILTLDSCIPTLYPDANAQTPTFDFLRLRELCLGGPLRTVQSLWECLRIPTDTRIRINAEDGPSRLIETLPRQLAFFDAISAHFRSPHCPPITALSMDDDQGNGGLLRLVLATPERGAQQPTWTGPLSSGYDFMFDLTFLGWNPEDISTLSNSTTPFLTLLKHVHSAFELKDLEVLELASVICFTPTQWRQALSSFTNITTLAIDPFPPAQGFWYFLCPRPNTFPPAFRKLETIAIEKTREFFMEASIEEDNELNDEIELEEPAEWSDLLPGLKRRAAAGFGISRLVFANFTAHNKARAERLLQDIRAVVPEVVGEVTQLDDDDSGLGLLLL